MVHFILCGIAISFFHQRDHLLQETVIDGEIPPFLILDDGLETVANFKRLGKIHIVVEEYAAVMVQRT